MGCMSTCAGCLLVTLNTIFLLIALAIGGIGGFIKWAKVDILVDPLTNSIKNANIDAEAKQEITNFIDQIFGFLRGYGLALFIVGLTLVIITMLAICGVCCQSKCLLITYAFIVFIFLACITAVTVLAFIKKDEIKTAGGDKLKEFLTKNYVAPNNSSKLFIGISGVFDLLQINFECCGITNYTDFIDADKWTNRTFVAESDGHTKAFYNLTIPPSCCKFKSDKKSLEDLGCLSTPDRINSNMYYPCYDKVWSLIDGAWDYVRYALIAITVFILLLFVAAVCASRFEKEKIDPI